MSIVPKSTLALFLTLASMAAPVAAQASSEARAAVRIEVSDAGEALVSVELPEKGSERRSLTFLVDHAGTRDLDRRLRDLKAFAGDGNEIASRYAGNGVFFADGGISSVKYKVDLEPPTDPTLAAHVSWFGCGAGALMLLDLLPNEALDRGRLQVSVKVPDGFFASSPSSHGSDGFVSKPRDAVFAVLPHAARRFYASSAGIDFNISITGEWQFSDGRLVRMTSDLLEEYKDLFGSGPEGEVTVQMIPVPCVEARDRWRAETRGSNVLILSSPATYANLGEQMAHEQLRHELLHLWIPNGLRLDGDYAWFFEGFTFYRSLLSGVQLGQIRFEDVLATLNGVRSRAARNDPWTPLAGSSGDRWKDESGTQYSRWVMAAFAADVLLHSRSGENVDSLLRDVHRKASKLAAPRDANGFLVSELSAKSALSAFVKESVEGSGAPDWGRVLDLAGLELRRGSLVPVERPTRRQKAFLRRLGYNDAR